MEAFFMSEKNTVNLNGTPTEGQGFSL